MNGNLLGNSKAGTRGAKTKSGKGIPETIKAGPRHANPGGKLALVFALPVVMLAALAIPVVIGSSPQAADVAGDLSAASMNVNTLPAQYENALALDPADAATAADTKPAAAAAADKPAPTASRKHKVAPGENLSRISKRYFGTEAKWKLIADANNLSEEQAKRLQVGQELLIPDVPNTAPSSAAPAAARETPAVPVAPRAVVPPTLVELPTTVPAPMSGLENVSRDLFRPQGPRRHVIELGDNLYTLAAKYFNGDLSKHSMIRDANPDVDWYNLAPGTEIVIPASASTTAAPLAPAPSRPSANISRSYRVQPGDTLWKISEKVYGSGSHWATIQRANNLSAAGDLKVGQELVIPDIR